MGGQVMGYSVHLNSVRNHQKELATKNQKEIQKVIQDAIQVYIEITFSSIKWPTPQMNNNQGHEIC